MVGMVRIGVGKDHGLAVSGMGLKQELNVHVHVADRLGGANLALPWGEWRFGIRTSIRRKPLDVGMNVHGHVIEGCGA